MLSHVEVVSKGCGAERPSGTSQLGCQGELVKRARARRVNRPYAVSMLCLEWRGKKSWWLGQTPSAHPPGKLPLVSAPSRFHSPDTLRFQQRGSGSGRRKIWWGSSITARHLNILNQQCSRKRWRRGEEVRGGRRLMHTMVLWLIDFVSSFPSLAVFSKLS